MGGGLRIKSVAIIGAGASGSVTAAALKAENYFDRIRVFERRETAGGTWIHDPNPTFNFRIQPGGLPPDVDPRLEIPENLPRATRPSKQERFTQTPIYESLTTNVPDIAMCFSDARFAYGPFAPHHIPRQYIENYVSTHKVDSLLVLNTTVEDISKIDGAQRGEESWKLSLRRFDKNRNVDVWWEENFDAVVFANGHYSVPYIPHVKGLDEYIEKYPDRIVHSKGYRQPYAFKNQKVVVIGNSASGHDVAIELIKAAKLPVYQSRRSKSRWDGKNPPDGIAWKPIISEFRGDGAIVFADGTTLDVDKVIYCTGYRPSFPFWNVKVNGRPLWDYEKGKLINVYQHTFLQDFPTLAAVGIPRVLTFRSFEYQAIAIARLWSGRNSKPLPPVEEQQRWEREREAYSRTNRVKFHDINWETGETLDWFTNLFEIAGLGTLSGDGRIPPVMGKELIWALEHIKKYPEPGNDEAEEEEDTLRPASTGESQKQSWVVVDRRRKDLLSFI